MSEDQPKGYLAKYGARLLDAGYRILPIPKGDKSPPKDEAFGDWRKVKATSALLRAWIADRYSRSGVGIDTRMAPGVDLDIMDETAADYMENWVVERFGAAPVRIGQAPKRLLAFRCDEEFPKITSKYWVDPWCVELGKDGLTKPYRVEILAAGQQYVAYHIHPDTGQPYKWVRNGSILKTAWEDLPVLTQEDAQTICDEFDRYAEEREWEVKASTAVIRRLKAQSGKNIDRNDVFANDKQKTDISDDDLRRKLMMVPGAETYETWVQIGMSLWHQYDGEQLGLDLWHEWSATASNYDSDALDEKWETFDAQGKSQTPLTARIIIKLADEQAAVIAVETFRELQEKIAATAGTKALQDVCEEIKKIEFGLMQRMQLANSIAVRYKLITGATMPIGTARTLIKYEQPKATEAPKWLEPFCYVQIDNKFFNTKTRRSLAYDVFNGSMNRWMLTKTEVLEGKSIPEAQAAAFALNNAQIKIVDNRIYLPGEDLYFSYNDLPVVNSYNDATIPDVPETLTKQEKRAIQTVKNHVKLLFPQDMVLIDAMAWIVQNPGQRLNWTILMQGQEGDGKTFFAGVLGAALGANNVRSIYAKALEKEFNGWAEGAQVVFIEEMKLQGHNKFDLLNAVKPLITNPTVSIRRMGTDHYEVPNMTTFFITTNFRDALPLDENSTRYYPMFSTFQTLALHDEFKAANPGYYANLFGALEHAGALRKWLLSHEISENFKGKDRAPPSPYKAEMISYTENEGSSVLRMVLSGRGSLDETLLDSHALAEKMSEHDIDVPYGRAMGRLLMDNGFTKLCQMKVGDKTPMFWSRRPQRFRSADGSPDLIAMRHYQRYGDL